MNTIRKALSNDSDSGKHSSTTPEQSQAMHGNSTGTGVTSERGSHGVGSSDANARSSTGGSSVSSAFGKHDHQHSTRDANEFDPKGANTTHHHSHLKEHVNETRHHHETEEVERVRDHERHVTHVQHHVQPVKDEEHKAEVHHQRAIPQTHVEERHISTDQDHKAFAGLHTHKDTVQEAPKQRTVVDLGEKVNTTTHHHVHNVIQPVIHKDTHEHHKIHTVIPTHHVEHHAPIVHQSVSHDMLSKDDFVKQGGVLGSNITHDKANVLAGGDCERKVDGVGEQLAKELHLGGTSHHSTGTTTTGSRV